MSHIPTFPAGTGRIFQPTSLAYTLDGKSRRFPGAMILTKVAVPDEAVNAAWTYALRFSAAGLDLPDYDAALELLIQRHPSWEIVGQHAHIVNPDLTKTANDVPET